MFDIGWQELFILAVLAIIVIGPKDLPRTIKTVTGWLRKARSMARELQGGIDDVVREAELDELQREANKIDKYDLESRIKDTIDPTGDVAKEARLDEIEDEMRKTAQSLKDSMDPDKATAGGEEAPPIVDDTCDVIDADVSAKEAGVSAKEEVTDDSAAAGVPEKASG